jgi:hypothetical protein
MKTAMQELIDELKYQFSHSDNHLQTIVNIVQKAQDELLEKEKEQIEIAFDLGRDEVTSVFLIDGEDYYNKSYNQNK